MPDMPETTKTIALAADHAGFRLKGELAQALREWGYAVQDLGVHGEERADYPDYGFALAAAVAGGGVPRGMAVCGSGIGISIALNRNPKVRAALCTDARMAHLARAHNDANVLVLGARLTDTETALDCARVFLDTVFEGGRHAARVAKLETTGGCAT